MMMMMMMMMMTMMMTMMSKPYKSNGDNRNLEISRSVTRSVGEKSSRKRSCAFTVPILETTQLSSRKQAAGP